MSLIKIPFIFSSTLAIYTAMTTPNRPSASEKLKPTGAEHILNRMAVIAKTTYLVCGSLEVAVILASLRPSSPFAPWILETFVLGPTPMLLTSNMKLTHTFLIGWILGISGAIIRRWCYHEMGRLFTFQLSIRKDHKLITTGPYSIVRHPSYTGAFINGAGASLCHFGNGSWMKECISFGRVFEALVWISAAVGVAGIISRIGKEDDMMKKRFGGQWEAWRKEVTWKLCPGVY